MFAGVCCLTSLLCRSRNSAMCTACCIYHVFTYIHMVSHVLIHCSEAKLELHLDLSSDIIFHLSIVSAILVFLTCFLFLLFTFLGMLIFFFRTPCFHLMLVKQLFLALIFVISYSEVIKYVFLPLCIT